MTGSPSGLSTYCGSEYLDGLPLSSIGGWAETTVMVFCPSKVKRGSSGQPASGRQEKKMIAGFPLQGVGVGTGAEAWWRLTVIILDMREAAVGNIYHRL